MDIKLDSQNKRLRIRFGRSLSKSIFGLKNRKSFSLALEDTAENRDLAQQIILEIKNDIRANKFSTDLNYYLPTNRLRRNVGIAYDPLRIKISLTDLYLKWFQEVKLREIRSEGSTYDQYMTAFLNVIKQCPQDLNNQESIVDFIVNTTNPNNASRICRTLENMFNWARHSKKYDFIHKKNTSYFKELLKNKSLILPKSKPGKLINLLIPNYVHNYKVKAFTEVEMYEIINRFHHRAFISPTKKNGDLLTAKHIELRILAYYFVLFKFTTGVRTGEATALKFCDIAEDNSYINIRHSWDNVNHKLQKCLKTEKIGQEGTHARKIFCDKNLSKLLEELRKRYYQKNTDFVFKKDTGRPFETHNLNIQWYGFCRSQYSKKTGKKELMPDRIGVIPELIKEKKIDVYLTAYNTRHTWINLQIKAGTNPLHICYTAGNTKDVMEMYYLSQPRPEEIDLKATINFNSIT